ncbi:ATP-grasp domain-containing protein [Streptomyces sp. NPDC020719]|uniref:carboxylate--amine ligase n=1 Tax=Streptomyces sp. NPDC020719 TaxID=3154896 RepID=UPI0033FE0474
MPALDRRVPAVLLRIDQNPFHHGTLGAVRSLGRAGVDVHVVAESASSPIACSRYLRPGRIHPPPRGRTDDDVTDDDVLASLVRVSDLIGRGRPAVLIPMDDLGALAVARLRERIGGRFLLPEQRADIVESVADKAELARLCAAYGIAHPTTVIPGSAEEAVAAVAELGLPVVAKWSRPWLLPHGSGLRSTTLVRSAREVGALYARRRTAGSALLLQRFLPAGPGRDWFFHGCAGRDGTLLAGGVGRKDRAWPAEAGLTAVGRWVPNPAVEASARRLIAAVGYRGIADLDFRLDAATGAYHLLDFNPRPGAQFRLFTDRSGLDVVRALHLDLTGRQEGAGGAAAVGRRFVVENYALLSLLTTGGRPGRGDRVGATEGAWFALDDPAPALAMSAGWGLHAVRKGLTAFVRSSQRRADAAAVPRR